MYNIPAVIFAGGKSSRMGKDKALLPFSTHTSLSAYQYHKLSKLFTSVYLSAKEHKFDFPCNVIKDRYKEYSPLVGLLSLFETLDNEALFILSVDAPLVDKYIIEKLIATYANAPKHDAIIAQSPKGIQPLCGVYSRSILPLVRDYLLYNKHKLTDLLKESHTKYIIFEDELAFSNLNTPQEYQKYC